MSRLLVLTRPELVNGFHLAGVEAFAAEDADDARKLIGKWLEEGESGLLAIDEDFLAQLDLNFRQKLTSAEQLPFFALPTGKITVEKLSGSRRIAELLRQAIGFHITFHGDQG